MLAGVVAHDVNMWITECMIVQLNFPQKYIAKNA
jgi:hypothetical protein